MADQEFYEFESQIDKKTKVIVNDFSLKCSRPDIIIVKIFKQLERKWKQIGQATIEITNSKKDDWVTSKLVQYDMNIKDLGGKALEPKSSN